MTKVLAGWRNAGSNGRREHTLVLLGAPVAVIEVDNRGVMPPEPMVRILAALESLAKGDELVALMDREPLLLYSELERRGCSWTFSETASGAVLTIHRGH